MHNINIKCRLNQSSSDRSLKQFIKYNTGPNFSKYFYLRIFCVDQSSNSLNLKLLPADLRKDENIVLSAIERYGYNLKFADFSLKKIKKLLKKL